jgi:pimeloyl-ACP methyl ester carboxylesterase
MGQSDKSCLAQTKRAWRLPIIFSLFFVLVLSGCVRPRLYRPDNIQQEEGYTLAFIEFDDQGELWSPSQMFRATELIKRANQAEAGSAFIVFIHGWQNNASPKQEQEEGKSLHGFKQLLSQTARRVKARDPTATHSVVGVYLAWRGKSAYKPFSSLTFWNRRRTANRIASGGAVTEVLTRILHTIDQNPASKAILIGHSFGGLLMEQAMLQNMVTSTVGAQAGQLDFPIDMVMLINPASPSLRAKQLIEVFARDRTKVYQVDNQGKRYERPLMISVTSRTDGATRRLYPMGTALGALFTRFRTYGPEFCSPAAKQRSFYLYTAGHNKILHSHVVTAKALPSAGESKKGLELQRGHDPTTQQETISFNGLKHRFTIERRRGVLNDTPYWIMNVPKELIPNHSDIFGGDTVRLVAALVQTTGVLEPNSRTVLTRETGLRALGLTVRATGELVFAERSRRLYALPAGSSTPVFLSCIPTGVDLADVVGFFGGGDAVTIVINRLTDEEGKGGKKEYRTELIDVSLTEGGFREAKPGRLAGSMRFVAATGDAATRNVYLATKDEIYIADLSESRPEPQPFVRIDVRPERMAFDATNKRLFTVDSETGRLYLIDLRTETPQVRLVAEGLGWPADIIIAPTDGRIYISDTKHKQIWRLNCDDVRCAKPQVFARHDAFRTPFRLAVAPDNTVWVADPKAQKIFALGPDGEIRQTISSLAGG